MSLKIVSSAVVSLVPLMERAVVLVVKMVRVHVTMMGGVMGLWKIVALFERANKILTGVRTTKQVQKVKKRQI